MTTISMRFKQDEASQREAHDIVSAMREAWLEQERDRIRPRGETAEAPRSRLAERASHTWLRWSFMEPRLRVFATDPCTQGWARRYALTCELRYEVAHHHEDGWWAAVAPVDVFPHDFKLICPKPFERMRDAQAACLEHARRNVRE